jgi:hypothetical protein
VHEIAQLGVVRLLREFLNFFALLVRVSLVYELVENTVVEVTIVVLLILSVDVSYSHPKFEHFSLFEAIRFERDFRNVSESRIEGGEDH